MIDTESDAGAWEEALKHSPCIKQHSAPLSPLQEGALPVEAVPVLTPDRDRLAGTGNQ